MARAKSAEEKAYWRNLWVAARANMPRKRGQTRGSARVLRKLLDYPVVSYSSDSQMLQKYTIEGTKPNDPNRCALLKQLAGPYGSIIARAVAINKKINLKSTPIWP